MTGSTHAASGMLAAESVLMIYHAPLEYWPMGLLFGAIAGLIPDLDHAESTVTRTLPFSGILSRFFPHRTVTHGIFGILGFALLLRFAFPAMPWVLFASIVAGYVSHAAVDMMNPQGIALLAPVRMNFYHLPFGIITTGTSLETQIFRPMIWAALILLTLSQFPGHTTFASMAPVFFSSAIVAIVALVITEKRYANFFHGIIFLSAIAVTLGWLWHISAFRTWLMGTYGQVFAFLEKYQPLITPIIGPIFVLYGRLK